MARLSYAHAFDRKGVAKVVVDFRLKSRGPRGSSLIILPMLSILFFVFGTRHSIMATIIDSRVVRENR